MRGQRAADAVDAIIQLGSPKIAVRSRPEGKSVTAGCKPPDCMLPRSKEHRCYTKLSRPYVHTTMRTYP